MKKSMKKLVLAKETIHSLGDTDMVGVAGGGTWQPSCSGCPASGLWFCPLLPILDRERAQ